MNSLNKTLKGLNQGAYISKTLEIMAKAKIRINGLGIG
jgi:hypothetical protein